MAENDILNLAGATTDIFMITLTIIILIILVVFVIWFIWYYKKFKHQITLRTKPKGQTDLVTFDQYRYVKKKGVAETIQLWKTKQHKPCPPDDAKDFTKKGNEYIECYEAATGELAYIKADDKILSPEFTAIDTDDKEFYANAFVQAQKFKRKNLLDIIIVLVLIFLITLAFWEEITLPMIRVSEGNAEISKQNVELLTIMEAIIKDKQYIPPEDVGEVEQPIPD